MEIESWIIQLIDMYKFQFVEQLTAAAYNDVGGCVISCHIRGKK